MSSLVDEDKKILLLKDHPDSYAADMYVSDALSLLLSPMC